MRGFEARYLEGGIAGDGQAEVHTWKPEAYR
jgi:hypothetical protein